MIPARGDEGCTLWVQPEPDWKSLDAILSDGVPNTWRMAFKLEPLLIYEHRLNKRGESTRKQWRE